MRRAIAFTLLLLVASVTRAAEGPVERWKKAVGGAEKVAAVQAIYRAATLELGGAQGTLEVWHTADGRYRKEERIATYSLVETFDGAKGTIRQGGAAARSMSADEVRQVLSRRFSNANAMFFVFFPDRHRGDVRVEDEQTIVFRPEGGIDWRVTLDPATSLPKTMVHVEGERTITVTFDAYETVDGITLEKELHRSAGDPSRGAVIRFTKTIVNPPLDPSLFTGER
jgi:hypothetical protein